MQFSATLKFGEVNVEDTTLEKDTLTSRTARKAHCSRHFNAYDRLPQSEIELIEKLFSHVDLDLGCRFAVIRQRSKLRINRGLVFLAQVH